MMYGRRPVGPTLRLLLVIAAAGTLITLSVMSVAALETEVVSPRTFTVPAPDGGMRVVGDEAVSGQVIARVADAVTAEQLHERLQAQDATLKSHIPNTPLVVVGLPPDVSVNDGVAMLSAEKVFSYVEPDRLVYPHQHPVREPNDALYREQWHWPRISAPMGWAIQTGSPEIVVAVIDSGYDPDHPDFDPERYWVSDAGTPGYDFWAEEHGIDKDLNDPDAGPLPGQEYSPGDISHGVHVAGIIGAATDNNEGVAGHDWNCRLMILRVFGPEHPTPSSMTIRATQWAIDNGADVINLSLGSEVYLEAWDAVIADAYRRGVVVVTSAGNDAHVFTDDRATWRSPVCNNRPAPGITNAVLGVAAIGRDNEYAIFRPGRETNRDASSLNFVDVSAPGKEILSTLYYDPELPWLGERYGEAQGTSMAAPIVSGLAALLLAQEPHFTVDQVIQRIRDTTDDISEYNPPDIYPTLGTGRVNTAAALRVGEPPEPVRNLVARSTPNTEAESITITWRVSPQDRDLLEYRLMRAEEAPDSDPTAPHRGELRLLATLEPGTNHYVDHDVEEGLPREGPWYWYQVIAVDDSHQVPSEVVGPVEAEDDVPPVQVETLVARDTPADDGGSISLSWRGYQPPQDLEYFNIYRAETEFTDVTNMEPHVTGLPTEPMQYMDTDDVVDGVEYWYAVTGVDDWDNEEKTVTPAGPVIANPNFAFSYRAGLSIISLGAVPPGEVRSIADIMGIAPGEGTNLAYWDPGINDYVIWSASPTAGVFNHRLGRAWWLKTESPILVNLSGQPAGPGGFERSVVPGWNMVGNPFATRLDFAGTEVTNIGRGTPVDLATSNDLGFTRDYAWAFDTAANSYRLVTGADLPFAQRTLDRGRGLLIRAHRPATLVLHRAVAPAATDADDERLALDGWALQLVAEAGGMADTDNFLGVASNADALSGVVSPPRPDTDLDLYFVRPSADGARLATDFVEPGADARWQIRVACEMPGSTVRLSWPDLTTLPNDVRPILVDNETGQAIYLRTSTGYNYEVGENPTERSFTLRLADDGAGSLAINTLSASASDAGAQIVFALSAPAAVDIEVLNIAGITVRRLVEGRQQAAGTQQVTWDGRNQSGSPVPAGRYIVRLTARSDSGQQTSAIRSLQIDR